MDPLAEPPRSDVPDDLLRTPDGLPAALVVRSRRGWTVLDPGCRADAWSSGAALDGLSLVEAMTLADLVAEEHGARPEPGRQARRAARGSGTAPDPDADPRDAELAELRRTVGQLEHALAARVSIERAIGVLAERHGTTPRVAFEELRRRARSQGRPAQELAVEVLETLAAREPAESPVVPVPGARRAVRPRPSRVPSVDGPLPETRS
jgi:ANTAR domain